MGNRYWITGTQLGLFYNSSKKERDIMIKKIIECQYLCEDNEIRSLMRGLEE